MLIFSSFSFVQADNSLDVVISEIAWMGTENSANDEWIKLYNNTKEDINLDGWILKSADGTPEINLEGIIKANNYFLLERTDDDTLPNISADQIYKGALENGGEYLELFDDLNNLVDSVNCEESWFAGDNSNKQTMIRKDSKVSGDNSNNWQTGQNPDVSPEKAEEKPIQIKVESEENKKVQEYPLGIAVNEILPSPEGSDAENEWIEIFNQNNFKVDLSGWAITDTIGKTKNYIFPKNTIIKVQEFMVLTRPVTKITLNNSGDGLRIIQPNKNIIEEVVFGKAVTGQSYSRIDTNWYWGSDLTPGSANIVKLEKQIQENKEEEAQFSDNFEKQSSVVASFVNVLQGKTQKNRVPVNNFFVILIAFSVAIFSAIAILFLKRGL